MTLGELKNWDGTENHIDLTSFINLRELSIPLADNILLAEKYTYMKYFVVTDYQSKTKDLTDLPELPALEKLKLHSCKIKSLKGIEKYSGLKILNLFFMMSLSTIEGIERLNIEEISVESCRKVKDWELLNQVDSLSTAFLQKCNIKQIFFDNRNENLKSLRCPDCKMID